MLENRVYLAYTDLLRVYGFDLTAWLRGETPASLAAVLTMLSTLPADCRFRAHLAASVEEPDDTRTAEEKAFDDKVQDNMDWNHQNRLLAHIVNAVNLNTTLRGNLSKDPKFPTVGPESWRARQPKKLNLSLDEMAQRLGLGPITKETAEGETGA